MKTSVETLDPVKVKLTVEVEPKRVKQAFDRAARELAKQVSLPGFRPGKAPRRLLEQRFGQGAIAQAAMEEALSTYYVEALKAEDLDPVAQPEVDVESFDETDGAVFTATVEVRPTFDPPDHTGVSLTWPEWEVEGDQVEEQLQKLRERFAEVDEVERAARKGDLVTIDLRVEVDGATLEGADVEDALYEIGSGGVTPKLDEEALGKEAGDTFTYEDELPEEYPEHGGETATFHVTVKDVREKTLPDLDDDFAATASGFDTLDELRDDLRASLQRRRIQEAQHDLRGRILEAYLARIEVPLPEGMVAAEKEQRIHQLEHQAERYGVSVEDLLEAEGQTREAFEEQAEKQAKGSVKAQLVLDALGQTLDLGLDPSEIDEEIVRHAQQTGMPPQEVARLIQQQGSLPMLIGDILRRKTIDAIVDGAELDGGPPEELLQELGLSEDPLAGATIVEAPTDAPGADVEAADAADGDTDDGTAGDDDE